MLGGVRSVSPPPRTPFSHSSSFFAWYTLSVFLQRSPSGTPLRGLFTSLVLSLLHARSLPTPLSFCLFILSLSFRTPFLPPVLTLPLYAVASLLSLSLPRFLSPLPLCSFFYLFPTVSSLFAPRTLSTPPIFCSPPPSSRILRRLPPRRCPLPFLLD